MSVSYDKLWVLLLKRKMNRSELAKKIGLTSNAIANMGKDKYVSLEILEKICVELEVTFDEIVEIVNDKKE